MDVKPQSRPFTKEETIDNLLGKIHDVKEIMEKTIPQNRRMQGKFFAYMVMSLISPAKPEIQIDPRTEEILKELEKPEGQEGQKEPKKLRILEELEKIKEQNELQEIEREEKSGLPRFLLSVQQQEEIEGEENSGLSRSLLSVQQPKGIMAYGASDIGREICAGLAYEKEMLIQMNKSGSRTQVRFILLIRALIKEYEYGKISSSDELVAKILEIIDQGFKRKIKIARTKFELKAQSSQRMIDKKVAKGENYYPLEGINIAGNLADRYRELYIKSRQQGQPDREKTIDD